MNTSKTCPIVEALREQNILPSNIITENFLHQSSIINVFPEARASKRHHKFQTLFMRGGKSI
jgi:hypothetical protein